MRLSIASSSSELSRGGSIFSTTTSRNSVASVATYYSQEAAPPTRWDSHSLQPSPASNTYLSAEPNSPSLPAYIAQTETSDWNPASLDTFLAPKEQYRNSTEYKRYWCTSCDKRFRRKFDWQRHEKEFHERWKKFPCPNCNQIFWGSNAFNQHHKSSHSCQTCPHADKVVKHLLKRKAWGCGFCADVNMAWEGHSEHVATHFESGKSKSDWKHSSVIYGLLHQPLIVKAWRGLLINKHGQWPDPKPRFEWQQATTGRAPGYTENECSAQLQDLLEFFGDGQDAELIVQMAYDKGLRDFRPKQSLCPFPENPSTSAFGSQLSSTTHHLELNSSQSFHLSEQVPSNAPYGIRKRLGTPGCNPIDGDYLAMKALPATPFGRTFYNDSASELEIGGPITLDKELPPPPIESAPLESLISHGSSANFDNPASATANEFNLSEFLWLDWSGTFVGQ